MALTPVIFAKSEPTISRPEDTFPPLLRAMFVEMSAYETCIPFQNSIPGFTCTFTLNNFKCTSSCTWGFGLLTFCCTIKDLPEDFRDKAEAYLRLLNRSGLNPSVTIMQDKTNLNCIWQFSSPEEMKNALSTFEDLFEPATWSDELTLAYLHGDKQFPFYCSEMNSTKKPHEIVLVLDVFNHLIKKGHLIEHAPQCGLRCAPSKDHEVQRRIHNLFKTLIEQGKGLAEATGSALHFVRYHNEAGCREGVGILKALAKKGHLPSDKLELIPPLDPLDLLGSYCISDKKTKTDLIEFVDEAVGHGHEIKVLAKAVDFFLRPPPFNQFALVLFEALLKRGFGVEEAKENVFPLFSPSTQPRPSFSMSYLMNMLISEGPKKIEKSKLKLLHLLIKYGHCHQEALENARILFRSSHDIDGETGLKIYKGLIEYSAECEQAAAEDAARRYASRNIFDKKLALALIDTLVRNNKPIKDAARFAIDAAKSAAYDLRSYGINLLQLLISKGIVSKEAIPVAIAYAKSYKLDEMNVGLTLLESLVDKGEALEEARKFATEGIDHPDSLKAANAFKLYIALVRKGHSLQEGLKAAEKGFASRNISIKSLALSLYAELVLKGHAIPQAREALNSIMDTENPELRSLRLNLSRALEKALQSETYFTK